MIGNLVFIGSYTAATERGKGIISCLQNETSGELTLLRTATEGFNPTFLCLSPDKRILFAVNEHWKNGEVSSFSIEAETGALTFLSKQSAQGGAPCHLCTNPSGTLLFVANHNDGSLPVFPITKDGTIEPASQLIRHEGKGPRPTQEGPHAHYVGFDPTGQFLLCVDKGIDKVMIYRLSTGKLIPNDPPFAALKPGTAPRHLAFHPNGHFAYVNGEADMSVTTFAFDGERGSFANIQRVLTLPETEIQKSFSAAEIAVHPSGKFLFVSNRGHDSISTFAIEPSSGMLKRISIFPSSGENPRHFAIDPSGRFVYVALQGSDTIVRLEIDNSEGALLNPTQILRTGSPVCILFVLRGPTHKLRALNEFAESPSVNR